MNGMMYRTDGSNGKTSFPSASGAIELKRGIARIQARTASAAIVLAFRARGWLRSLRDEEGQGTTEYAILVGILVVIAIAAIVAFRGKIQELWTAIADGINGL
jgi:Flp pilus assembly pilin Flp